MELIKISVGIPAYNEEYNIKALLQALLVQQAGKYELKEILVVSDGSTDKTVEVARSLNSPLIRVIDRPQRKGASETQNELLDNYVGEALVMLDADIIPDPNFLALIIEPFYSHKNIGIVSNFGKPFPAKTFFQAVLNFATCLKEKITRSIEKGDNIYNCHGHSRVFSRAFTQVFRWQFVVSEDAFSYLECKRLGFEFVYVSKAIIHFSNPDNFSDHLKQSHRFFDGQKGLSKFIPAETVKQAHRIPLSASVVVVKNFLLHPILTVSYFFVLVLSFCYSFFSKTALVVWDPVTSSKQNN